MFKGLSELKHVIFSFVTQFSYTLAIKQLVTSWFNGKKTSTVLNRNLTLWINLKARKILS